MATKTSAPAKKGGSSNNSISYSVADREAKGTPTQPSSGGLDKIKSGTAPEKGTNDIC